MFGFYISLPFLLFALYRLAIVVYNYFTRPFLPVGIPIDNPLVAILVYVRNSEKYIGQLLQGISNQTHQNYEVLIYNDQSNDKTVDIISELSAGDKRVRLFNGNDVANGWQRKNYAYDRLTQLSKGQYYIFIDSDFYLDNQFVVNALSHMQQKNLSLLTIYPKLQSQNFWVRMQISAVQWMFLSLVFAKSYLRKRARDKSILLNPLIISEATSYQSSRWHERFKIDENPEVKIADAINTSNLKSDSLLADNSLTYEVVDSYSESNICIARLLTIFFKDRNGLIAYTVAAALGLIVAIFLLPFPLVFLYLFAIIYGRMLVALLCQQSVIVSLLLLPTQYFALIQILVNAIKKK